MYCCPRGCRKYYYNKAKYLKKCMKACQSPSNCKCIDIFTLIFIIFIFIIFILIFIIFIFILKLGAGEGLLPSARTLWMPSARTLWMPPRGLYTPQEVDRQQ